MQSLVCSSVSGSRQSRSVCLKEKQNRRHDESDVLPGTSGDDSIKSGKGDDVVLGLEGEDKFNCGKGEDTVFAFNATEGDKASGNCENLD